jgi:hypothetical protein
LWEIEVADNHESFKLDPLTQTWVGTNPDMARSERMPDAVDSLLAMVFN